MVRHTRRFYKVRVNIQIGKKRIKIKKLARRLILNDYLLVHTVFPGVVSSTLHSVPPAVM